jgi:glycosyltransferase involved in cell wall biosynthesis
MLTVLLATRNRARILRDVLESYSHLRQPLRGWKLVVVDNGSTDQTAQVVTSFIGRLPLQFLVEPKVGKNFALNTGIELLDGDLTVFTDDDTFPNSDWLVELRRAADAQPVYSMFGGVIVPRWEVPPPAWVRWVNQGAAYTLTHPSLKEGPIAPTLVFGPNMAVRADVFRSGIRFDPAIGPRGACYPMGSETELALRLAKLGHQAWHVKGAIVEHFIRVEQLKKKWIWGRAIRFGRGKYRMMPTDPSGNVKLWMGIPRYLFRRIVKQGLVMIAAYATFRRETLFRSRWEFNDWYGQAIEAHKLARERAVQTQLSNRRRRGKNPHIAG